MAVIAAATAVYTHKQMADAAEQQHEAITKNLQLQTEDSTRQSQQQASAAAAQLNDQNRQAMKDSALADAVTGEYGGGRTTDRGSAVASIQNSEALASIQNNSQTAQSEIGFQARAAHARAVAQIGAIQKPSNIGTALTIAGAGASAYNAQTSRAAALKAKAGTA